MYGLIPLPWDDTIVSGILKAIFTQPAVNVYSKLISRIDIMSNSCEIGFRWVLQKHSGYYSA